MSLVFWVLKVANKSPPCHRLNISKPARNRVKGVGRCHSICLLFPVTRGAEQQGAISDSALYFRLSWWARAPSSLTCWGHGWWPGSRRVRGRPSMRLASPRVSIDETIVHHDPVWHWLSLHGQWVVCWCLLSWNPDWILYGSQYWLSQLCSFEISQAQLC